MIGLDTNVLIRYITQDDVKQSQRATILIDSLTSENPGFVSLVSLVELVWVMEKCYRAVKPEILAVLETLLRTQELRVENTDSVLKAINIFAKSKADFSDCLIERSCDTAGCEYTVTFDTSAAKYAGMRLAE